MPFGRTLIRIVAGSAVSVPSEASVASASIMSVRWRFSSSIVAVVKEIRFSMDRTVSRAAGPNREPVALASLAGLSLALVFVQGMGQTTVCGSPSSRFVVGSLVLIATSIRIHPPNTVGGPGGFAFA